MSFFEVCDSDTVLDPACTIEMLKILEEDPMVGGVGGDVQVKYNTTMRTIHVLFESQLKKSFVAKRGVCKLTSSLS